MNDTYITTDIYLATTLSALDFTLEKITQQDNKFQFHFVKSFNNDDNLPPVPISIEADQYWTDNLLVNPKKLFSEFKEIKTRMYDLRRRENGTTA